jgi:MFS family permease
MAGRGWTRSIFLAMLGAAGTAAAQLGLGYGLAIIAWVPPDGGDPATTGAWSSSLGWATFIAATSVVVGAVLADRSRGDAQTGRVLRLAWCLVLAFAASIGALLAVPLVAVPASRAAIADNYAPHLLAIVYAVLGVVLGLLIALIALASRAVAANVMTTAGWLWALAVIAVSGGVAAGRLEYAPLGVWKFTNTGPVWHGYYVPGVLILLGGALLAGGLGAYPGAARGDGRLGVALSGAFGPLLVVASYELASPQADNARFEQVSALHIAPYMVLAGLIGSALVTAVGGIGTGPRRRGSRRSAHRGRPAPAPTLPAPAPMTPSWNQPTGGRPLPAASPNAVTGTATVPASARLDPHA